MKIIIYIKLLLLILAYLLPVCLFAQNIDSTRLITNYGIYTIKIGERLKKEQLLKYSYYKKTVKLVSMSEPLHLTKTYFVKNGLTIYLQKRKKCGFTYIVTSIGVKYPFKGFTDKGIEIGKSNKKDVIEKYGKPINESSGFFSYDSYSFHQLIFVFDSTNIVSEIIIN